MKIRPDDLELFDVYGQTDGLKNLIGTPYRR
jgi:hypothetical protein